MHRYRCFSIFLLVGLLTFAATSAAAAPSAGQAPPETSSSNPPGEASVRGGDSVRVVPHRAAPRVDVFVGEERFTSYFYADTLDVLKKPVLYPIQTAEGTEITRGYPLSDRAGERADHPHHIGFWLNYGNVNGLDFWGNSNSEYARENKGKLGTIRHRAIRQVKSGEDKGVLAVTMDWLRPGGEPILREETRFVFRADAAGARMIDRITTLTALGKRVRFPDTKEGMLGLRVRRALEMPAGEPVLLTGTDGQPMDEPVMDDEGVTGHYQSSTGTEGYPDVWGTRAKWMMLSGEVGRKLVTVAILDHPSNVGFPTYWHARDYGLFSANPLGQEVFSEGERTLNFSLAPGESTTFRYRLLVLSGEDMEEEVTSYYRTWADETP